MLYTLDVTLWEDRKSNIGFTFRVVAGKSLTYKVNASFLTCVSIGCLPLGAVQR